MGDLENERASGTRDRWLLGARIFPGWWIVLAALVLNLFHGGAFTYGFSLFIEPLADARGWSRSAISAVWSGALVVSLLLAPVIGLLIDRYGGRTLVWAGVPAFGLAYLAMPGLQTYGVFFMVVVGLMGFGLAAGINGPGEAEIAYWFRRRRALAMGMATTGAGIAGLTLMPVLGWLIHARGWESAAIALGLLVIICAYPLGHALKGRPEDYGEYVDGVRPSRAIATGDFARRDAREPDFSVAQALRTSAFWLLNMAFALRWLGVSMVAVHQVPYLIDLGFSETTAAGALGGALALSIPSRLVFGWFADRTSIRLWLMAAFLAQGISVLILIQAGQIWTIYVYALLFGIGNAALPLSSALIGEYFGRQNYATIQGSGRPFTQIGRVLGAMTGGIVFDLTGEYRLALIVTATSFFIGTVLLILAREPDRQPVTPNS